MGYEDVRVHERVFHQRGLPADHFPAGEGEDGGVVQHALWTVGRPQGESDAAEQPS